MIREMLYDEDGVSTVTRYAIEYKGFLFEGDTDDWNTHDMDDWEHAYSIYTFYSQYPECDIAIIDRYYGVTLRDDEWY